MKKKQVWRYNCDHCNAKKYTVASMKHHEERCTMNPDRICGMCAKTGCDQKPMADILAVLPDPIAFKREGEFCDSYPGFTEALKEAWPALIDVTEACPVCILAGLRQKGIHPGDSPGWDFKKACASIFSDMNDHPSLTVYYD